MLHDLRGLCVNIDTAKVQIQVCSIAAQEKRVQIFFAEYYMERVYNILIGAEKYREMWLDNCLMITDSLIFWHFHRTAGNHCLHDKCTANTSIRN